MILLLAVGIFLTLFSGFFPFRKAGFIIKSTFGGISGNKKAFSAAATALGATVGTGNIIGVSAAISIGGAGAVFWMWVGAFFGMMLKFAEAALAVKYKGGANIYIEKAFGGRTFSVLWCICCVLASFGGGNMIQSNAAGDIFEKALGISPLIIGAAICAVTAFVLFRGADFITKASSFLVPLMAVIYILGCFAVLFIFRENIIPAFSEIFSSAFEPLSAGGGIAGILLSESLRAGLSKGSFTHEAGMGSASLAHAESGEKSPLRQGCWGIAEVFIDTVLVCSLTALVILSVPGAGSAEEAFHSVFGLYGDIFLCVSMFLFALAAVFGWAFYGEKALLHITKSKKAAFFYRTIFCFAAIFGTAIEIPVIWSITDIFNGLMIFPNLAAIMVLTPKVFEIAKENPAS
ncbi:MAG: sodium:alanine symporter family protein [Oscillospiraceae bacterium]|nr:sodium:alanine symporter family protein [Oscillospiraceae bacterium]